MATQAPLAQGEKHRFVKLTVTMTAVILALLCVIAHIIAIKKGQMQSVSALVFYTLFATLFLIRKPSLKEVTGLRHWVIALGGSFLPFLITPGSPPASVFIWIAIPLQVIGGIYMFFAILCLGRSFGVIAAHREIKTHGLYRIVRHPLYSAELMGFMAVVLQNLNVFNVVLFCLQVICQIGRMEDEEGLLTQDDEYKAYKEQVRYRLFPGIY